MYDGFISYSRSADEEFAPKIQDGLEKLTKRWNQRRALKIFQDIDDLPASDDLPATLLAELQASTTLVFLASPLAAGSKWCNAELEHWRDTGRPLVIILTDGTLVFDRKNGLESSTAAPPAFMNLRAEPVYVDMSEERQRFEALNDGGRRSFSYQNDSEFRAKLTKVAAAVHTNKNPDNPVAPRDIDSQDKRAHDSLRRLRNSVASILVLLTVLAGISALVAVVQRQDAEQGRRIALSKQLAVQSIDTSDEQLDLGSLLAIEAYRTEQTPDAFGSWITAAYRSADVARLLHGHERPLRGVAFNENGSLMASTGLGGMVQLWDGLSFEPIGDPLRPSVADPENPPSLRSVVFSPNEPLIAVAGSDDRVYFWDVSDTANIIERPFLSSDLHDGRSIRSIAFSADGTVLASAGGFKSDAACPQEGSSPIVLSNLESGISETLGSIDGCVTALAFSPTAPTLASAQRDGSVAIWNTRTRGDQVRIADAHGSQTSDESPTLPASAVAFSPSGTRLASAGWDGVVKVWDVATPIDPISSFRGHDGIIRSVAFSPDGTLIASGDRNHQVMLWNSQTGIQDRTLSASHSAEVRSVAFHPSGAFLASAGADQTIAIWNIDDQERRSLSAPLHGGKVRAVLFDDQHDAIITGGAGVTSLPDGGRGPGIVWADVPVTGAAAVSAVPDELAALALDPATGTLASGDARGALTLWDSATRLQQSRVANMAELGCRDFISEQSPIRSLAFHPSSSMLAIGFQNGAIMLTDAVVGDGIDTQCTDARSAVWDLTFSPDGERLVASSSGGRLLIWDIERKELTRLDVTTEEVLSVDFDPNGELLAVGGSDGDIIILDAESMTVIGEPLRGHNEGVQDLAFHPHDPLLASASSDGSVILWNVDTRVRLADELVDHGDQVFAVAWILEGAGLASGGDGSALIWDLQPATLRTMVCEAANRNLSEFEWNAYVGSDRAYRRSCDEYPPGIGAT